MVKLVTLIQRPLRPSLQTQVGHLATIRAGIRGLTYTNIQGPVPLPFQNVAQQSELTRELLAKYIIEQARHGELDERRLRDGALLHLPQSNLRRSPTNSRL